MTWEKFDSGYYADAQEELFAALDASRLEVLRMTTLVDQAQAARQCDAENYRGEIQRLKAAYEPGGSGVPGYEATVDALESEHVEVLGLRARVAELKAELVLCKSTVAELRESDALVDGCHKREVDALKVRVEDLEAGLKKYGKHVQGCPGGQLRILCLNYDGPQKPCTCGLSNVWIGKEGTLF